MGALLLPEVIPVAAGVLVYSVICLLFSLLLIWLVWVHRERGSYVAMLGYFTFLSTLASILQQIHTIVDWRNIKIDQYNVAVANQGSIVVAVPGPSTGLDLGLFFVQYYSYNVEAIVALCWAVALTHSIYGWSDIAILKRIGRSTNISAKIVAVTLPVVLISLLQLDAIRASAWAFLLVANINLLLSPTLGAIALLLIMGKYIHTKRHLMTWNVRYGKHSQLASLSLSQPSIDSAVTERKSIYDNWLMIRFTIGFFCLSAFEVAQIMFQLASMSNIAKLGDSADLSAARARLDFLLFMPGCAASFVVFLVFGTTQTFMDTIFNTFFSKCLRRRRRRQGGSSTAVESSSSRTFTPSIGGGGGGSSKNKGAPLTTSNYPNLEDLCLSPCTEDDGMTFKLPDIGKPKAAHTRNSSWPDFSTFVVRMSRQSVKRITTSRKKSTITTTTAKDPDDEWPILNSPVFYPGRLNDSAV
ncbi:glycoside hydrolase [Apiospora aurea]|uniref:Glycoside hydrolase n=1 Tax=Apiospora aurea TaxID=335848 RepID=A0ABR1Q818_9PEZI